MYKSMYQGVILFFGYARMEYPVNSESLQDKLIQAMLLFEMCIRDSSSTLGDVISKINTSEAGVKVSYSSIEDKFIMESKTTGDISNILMEQTSGNLLTVMFGTKSADTVTGSLDGVKSSKDLVSVKMCIRDSCTALQEGA